jgi:hypothetical protein
MATAMSEAQISENYALTKNKCMIQLKEIGFKAEREL